MSAIKIQKRKDIEEARKANQVRLFLGSLYFGIATMGLVVTIILVSII